MQFLRKARQRLAAGRKATLSLERRNGVDPTAGMVPPAWPRLLMLGGLSLLLALLTTPYHLLLPVQYQVGDVAERNVRAVRDFLVPDEAATEQRRQEAATNSLAVYDLDEEPIRNLRQRLASAFAVVRPLFLDTGSSGRGGEGGARGLREMQKSPREQVFALKKEFEAKVGGTLSDRDYAILVQEKFDPRLEEGVTRLAESVFAVGVVSNKTLLLSQLQRGVILRSIQNGAESHIRDLLGFLSLDEAKRQMRLRAGVLLEEEKRPVLEAVVHLAQAALQPNITFNLNETEIRKQRAVETIRPALFQVKKGEMLIREGQRVGAEHILKLETQARSGLQRGVIFTVVGTALMAGLLVWLSAYAAGRYISGFPTGTRDLLFLTSCLGLLLVLAKLSAGVADALTTTFPFISPAAVYCLLPLAAGPMLVAIFFGPASAILFAIVLAVLSAFLLERQFNLLFYYLIGSLVAIHRVEDTQDRTTPLKAGLAVSLVNAVVIVIFTLTVDEPLLSARTGAAVILGVAGGMLSGVITTGLSPMVEWAFDYTTSVKLLELANMEQPLLRGLMVQAPGSYHHSLMVGNMVEAAAKSIGANALLARVAAYYHDIGKIKKPLYFVENQAGGENRHERLAPSMSSLILISHVRDGVELAKDHHLGKAIQDIIQQHHGTGVISYFYQKAIDLQEKLKSSKGGEVSPVLLEDYRYPGPKPQTKEAGLVLLADAVEAASRTVTEPTAARIQGMVQKITNKIFTDGQLDECELTLKDLHEIAKSFIQILTAIFHQRIDYPEPAAKGLEGRARADGDSGSKPAKRDRNGSREDRGKGKEDLKRLGLS
ncbi:MAG: receptor with intracellular metal dependent phosphohydrolase [Deltaproteobacteria bacterium]|nr:receptor with intracellular metal dependent phosphohydrolase [Deltaproteobacteria bacterium]